VAFAIKNSSTRILPQWWEVLSEFNLKMKMMPWNITTRWNFSFDMLNFALDYWQAINTIINEKKMKLRQYKLLDKDWKIVRQPCDVIKVMSLPICFTNCG